MVLVLSDEVYAYIVFDKKHISARSNEILRERSIITSSFGKTYHVTGWKVGYLTAPKYLLDEIKRVEDSDLIDKDKQLEKLKKIYTITNDGIRKPISC